MRGVSTSGWSQRWARWTALAESDVPNWERDMVRDAEWVDAGFGERYIRVPKAESREGYADMGAFIETVANAHLRDRLSRATHREGHGAFRRFKDILLDAQDDDVEGFA